MPGRINEKALMEYISRQPDVEFAVLFGSAAADRMTSMSDIDLAVYFSGNPERLAMGDRQVELTCDIMALTGNSRVDVVVLNAADPLLAFQVVAAGRLLHAQDERKYIRFKAGALGRYQDIKPMYDLHHRATEHYFRGRGNG